MVGFGVEDLGSRVFVSLAFITQVSHGALHEIVSDDPRFETDLATSPSPPSSQPCDEERVAATDLSLKLARLWVERHGRRFRVYRERQDNGILRGPRAGSENALVSLQRAGRGKLLRKEGEDRQLLGVPRAQLTVEPSERRAKYRLADVLTQFRRTTTPNP